MTLLRIDSSGRKSSISRQLTATFADFSDEEIVHLVGAAGLSLFRNYFNRVLDTDIDAPPVRAAEVLAHAARG